MKNNYDIKDMKLLYELDINSRQSYGQIGRKIRLSKNAVAYRIQRLQKEGIIEKFHTVINVSNLGYSVFRLYINLCNTTPEKETEIIEFLKKNKIVTWMVSMEGEYDLAMLLVVKDIGEINDFWKEFIDKYLNYFDKRLLTLLMDSNYFPKAYIADMKKNNIEFSILGKPIDMKIHNKDYEILRMLSDNSRAQIIDISQKIKLNPKTVISRIRYLEKNKIIVGYKTVFNLNKLGYTSYKFGFTLLKANKETLHNFIVYCKEHPNIVYQETTIGGSDIEIEIQVKNNDKLREVINDIKKRFAHIIYDYKMLYIYSKHKSVFLPLD